MNLDLAGEKVNKLIKDGFRAGWMKDFLKYKKRTTSIKDIKKN